MNKYLSDKLRVISFISIIMVVFLHSFNGTVRFTSGNLSLNNGYSIFIQEFLSHGITNIAIPMFFCISAYLIFLKFGGTMSEFIQKYRKRAKSLLLPYLIWSLWGLLLCFLLQSVPQSRQFFTNDLIINYSFAKLLNTIFLDPISYQLWFLRDLIVLVFFLPLIYFLIRYLRAIPIILFFIIWLDLFKIDLLLFSNESVFFFFLGAYISIYKSEYALKKLNQKYYWLFTVVWILIVLLKTIIIYNNPALTPLPLLLHKVSILVGLIALWSMYDILMLKKENPNKIIFSLSFFSFFLYVFHEPVSILMKKGLFYILGSSELTSLIIYFSLPIMIITISISLGAFIKKIAPKFYMIITGGR